MNTHTRAMAVASALLLSACGSAPDKQASHTPGTAATQSESAAQAADKPVGKSSALTARQYHRDIAEHMMGVNKERTYGGAPPNPLAAIVVLEVELDRHGGVLAIRPVRVPDHGKKHYEWARQSVLRSAPFPQPAVTVALGKPRIALTETWLFDNDGKFQLRSLALPQQGE